MGWQNERLQAGIDTSFRGLYAGKECHHYSRLGQRVDEELLTSIIIIIWVALQAFPDP